MAGKKKKRKKDVEVEDDFTEEVEVDENEFAISKTRMGKPELVVTAVNFTAEQNEHLATVCKEQETSRAEFVRQAVSFCLRKLGEPFPE